ncbi:MAG: ABC transporter ATP-binding protein [Defluviitaleaceae bacterium]|nr:ABC transporter ATP-binding protein [Defluviitaleaceae bacterium]
MENILEITGLSHSYGKNLALGNISLGLPKGKIVGVLGPNGSGKTTLIKIIMGLINGYDGQVRIAGEVPGIQANPHISYLPDRNHIPSWLTTSQAINLFGDFYPDFDQARANDMLERMKIPPNTKIKTLSRGTQEKVQLAMVMSRRACLYVLDEPLGAVDPASREFIVNTILKNYPEDGTILLSTHIISDIEPVLDIAIFLREGEIVLMDDADKIREEHGKSLDGLFREVFRNAD